MAKEVERLLGRRPNGHWRPRPIDVDLLFCGARQVASETLTVPPPPHRGARLRALAPRRGAGWPPARAGTDRRRTPRGTRDERSRAHRRPPPPAPLAVGKPQTQGWSSMRAPPESCTAAPHPASAAIARSARATGASSQLARSVARAPATARAASSSKPAPVRNLRPVQRLAGRGWRLRGAHASRSSGGSRLGMPSSIG